MIYVSELLERVTGVTPLDFVNMMKQGREKEAVTAIYWTNGKDLDQVT